MWKMCMNTDNTVCCKTKYTISYRWTSKFLFKIKWWWWVLYGKSIIGTAVAINVYLYLLVTSSDSILLKFLEMYRSQAPNQQCGAKAVEGMLMRWMTSFLDKRHNIIHGVGVSWWEICSDKGGVSDNWCTVIMLYDNQNVSGFKSKSRIGWGHINTD